MELSFPAICEAVAQRRPDDTALVFRDRSFTWQQVQDRTRRLAMVLLSAGLGPQGGNVGPHPVSALNPPESRVALYLLNGNEYLEGMLGSWKARCIPFNVNYRYVAAELRYLLEDSGAEAVIVHDRFTSVLADVIGTMDHPPRLILAVADGSERAELPGLVDYEGALGSASPELPPDIVRAWSGDDHYLCYTGGTTGMPKGALWRQGDFLVSALGVTRKDGSEFESIDEVADFATSSMRAMPAPPLMHGAAHWNAMSAWIGGGTIVIQDVVDHFDPTSILETAERHRATSLLLVGDPMARPLLDVLDAESETGTTRDLSSIRHIVSGGAVLSAESKRRLLDRFSGVRIIDVLGSTESGRQGIASAAGDSTGNTGRFVSADTAKVLNEDLTRVLRPGEDAIGWLTQSGRVPLGYMNDPDKSARTFPVVDGVRYAVAGDRARVDADGAIELLGRDSVCINTGGEKVFAEEVETALKSHPAVLDAVVCGTPSERFGEEVVGIVEFRGGVETTDDELLESAGRHLARYKLPRRIIRTDNVVRSPSGKADYRWAKAKATESD